MKKILFKLNNSVTGGAIIIAVFSIISKILGLLRDRLLASGFGAGDILDAYYAAFRLPDLIFNTLVLGALSAAFIPVFVSLKRSKGKNNSQQSNTSSNNNFSPNCNNSDFKLSHPGINHWQLSAAIINIIFLCLICFSVIAFIFAPGLMSLIAPGFEGQKLGLAVSLTRIMLISILFFGVSNVLSGILQSIKRFTMFALAPVMYNIGIIFGIIFLVPWLGPRGLAFGVVAGSLLHLLVQIPSVYKAGFRWQPILELGNKAVKKVIALMLPRTLGLAVGQLNQLVINIVASTLAAGSIAVFNLSFNLASVPISVFAISLAIASFPCFSESFAEKNNQKFIIQFSGTVRKIFFLIIPISVFMIALRAQIVRLVLGAGQFDWRDTILTADTLGYFCISLFAQGLIPLLARAFYAAHNTKTPVITSFIAVAVNIAGLIFLTPIMGVTALGLSFSISSIIHLILLYLFLKKKIGYLDEKNIVLSVFKIITATIGAVVFIQISKYLIASVVDMRTFIGVLIQFCISGFIGVIVFIAVSWMLGVRQLRSIWAHLNPF